MQFSEQRSSDEQMAIKRNNEPQFKSTLIKKCQFLLRMMCHDQKFLIPKQINLIDRLILMLIFNRYTKNVLTKSRQISTLLPRSFPFRRLQLLTSSKINDSASFMWKVGSVFLSTFRTLHITNYIRKSHRSSKFKMCACICDEQFFSRCRRVMALRSCDT